MVYELGYQTIARELAYYDVAVQHISYATGDRCIITGCPLDMALFQTTE